MDEEGVLIGYFCIYIRIGPFNGTVEGMEVITIER